MNKPGKNVDIALTFFLYNFFSGHDWSPWSRDFWAPVRREEPGGIIDTTLGELKYTHLGIYVLRPVGVLPLLLSLRHYNTVNSPSQLAAWVRARFALTKWLTETNAPNRLRQNVLYRR